MNTTSVDPTDELVVAGAGRHIVQVAVVTVISAVVAAVVAVHAGPIWLVRRVRAEKP